MTYYIEIDERDIDRFRIDDPCKGSHGNKVLVLEDKNNMTIGFELLKEGGGKEDKEPEPREAITNQNRLALKLMSCSPEDAYEMLGHLLLSYANMFTDSREAVIQWLRKEQTK